MNTVNWTTSHRNYKWGNDGGGGVRRNVEWRAHEKCRNTCRQQLSDKEANTAYANITGALSAHASRHRIDVAIGCLWQRYATPIQAQWYTYQNKDFQVHVGSYNQFKIQAKWPIFTLPQNSAEFFSKNLFQSTNIKKTITKPWKWHLF